MNFFPLRLLIVVSFLWYQAQAQNSTRYQPDVQQLLKSYHRAAWMHSTVFKNVLNQQMRVNWQKAGSNFCVMLQKKDGVREFIKGNVQTKKTEPVFDQEKMLVDSNRFMKEASISDLNFTQTNFDLEKRTATVEMKGTCYKVDFKNYQADKTVAPPGFQTRSGREKNDRWNRDRGYFVSPEKN